MDVYIQIANKIIQEQELIIGPIAVEQARKVSGLEINEKDSVTIKGNAKNVIGSLIDQYAKLFGKASIEVCRDAVRDLIPKLPKDQVPSALLN